MSNIRIDFLAHADFSGRLRKSKKAPGSGVYRAEIEKWRSQNPDGTILLDAGDEFSTTFWPGRPMVRSVSLRNTDAMVLGNHEFDRGESFLSDCISYADFPILCANVIRKSDRKLIPGCHPWVMVERKGIKIGIIGVTTEYTPYMVTASSFEPFEVLPCADAVKKYLPEVQSAGAQIVVLLAHIPFYYDEQNVISGELVDLLQQIPHVDVCIGGHIPGDYAGIWEDTVVLKGGFSGKSLCHATLWYDTEKNCITEKTAQVHLTDWDAQPIEPDESHAKKTTDPYKDFFEKSLTVIDKDLHVRLSAETKLGNFFAQSVQEAAGTQFAYINATCSGGTVHAGTVTAEDITSVMGFDDPILTTQMTGQQIWNLFELVYEPERYGNNASLMFSGVIVHIDHTKPAFQKVQSISMRDGSPLEMYRVYSVASSEYMSSGGNDTAKIANQLSWKPTGINMYDALFSSIKRHQTIFTTPEQRLVEIGTPENDHAPF